MKYNVGDIVPFEQTQEATDWANSVEGNYYLTDYERDENGNMQLIVCQFVQPEPTPEEIQKQMTDAVQVALDNFAKTRGYDGIMSACSYGNSTDAQFKLEADYCIQLRDTTWRMGYAILAEVKAGTRPIPPVEELIAELPVGSAKWSDEE